MAESHLPIFVPCRTYSALLSLNAVASGKYHEATSDLMSLAGQGKFAIFAKARRNCEICLKDCKRTAAAMRAHKAAHGC